MEVPANTALVVSRESGGVLNILLSPLAGCGVHERQEEVARCLEAVSHAAGFGADGGHGQHALHHVRSAPMLAHADSRLSLDGPADSMDSGVGHGGGTPMHPSAMLSRLGDRSLGGAAVTVGEDDLLTGHPGHSVLCMAAANGLLFSGGTDSCIKVRRRVLGSVGAGQCLASAATWAAPQHAPQHAPLLLPAASAPQVWSLSGSKCVATLQGHRGPIRKLEIVGGRLFSGR